MNAEMIMIISLAFGSTGSGGRAEPKPAPWAPRSGHRTIDIRRSLADVREDVDHDVGLEALGQVLAEPRGFVDRSSPDGANDAAQDVARGADRRVRAGIHSAHRDAAVRARRTIAGGFEGAIVIALLAGGSAFAGYPIVGAVADSALARATKPANAHVTETITAGGARAVVETTIRRIEPVPRS
jgi:hypothetical protein